MSLHDTNLTKTGDKFQGIEGKIESENTPKQLAKMIAKYREDIAEILNTEEAQGVDDQTDLKNLIKRLKDKRKDILKDKLGESGTPCYMNFTDDTAITDFWKRIIAANWDHTQIDSSGLVPKEEKDTLKKDILEALKSIQYLHDKPNGDRSSWKLFGGKSDNMANVASTLGVDKIDKILNVNVNNPKEVSEIGSTIENFVKSVTRRSGNPFYIQHTKLDDLDEKTISIRIAGYLYMVYQIIKKNCLTANLKKEITKVLEQITENEAPKIKGLHNTKVELGYLEPEYETLKDLNDKAGDEDLGEKDLGGGSITETRNLKVDFENGIATGLERYEVDSSNIEIKDGDGNSIIALLNDGTRDITSLFSDIGNTKNTDLSLEIGGEKLKIGKIVIDNQTGIPKFIINFYDETTIKTEATSKGILIPKFPLDFSINLKGIKDVKNGLKGCKASLTKKYTAKLKLGSIVPGPHHPPFTLREQRERQTTITNVDQVNRAIAEREADEELRERYRNSGRNIFDKANLFLRRNFIRDKLVYKKMKGKSGVDWSESGQSAAHRHQIEKQESLADNLNSLVDIDKDNYPQTRAMLDKLIDDVTGKNSVPPRTAGISDSCFQTQFEYILKKSGKDFDKTRPGTATVANWKPVSKIIKSNNMNSLSTNILMQARQFQAHQHMVYTIQNHIATNPTESDDVFNVWCRGEIENYINTYDDIPDFLQQMGLSIDNVDDIKRLKGHTASLAAIQAQALKYRVQILDGGSEAYNVKKEGGRLTKIGKLFDDPTGNSKFFKRHPHLKETIGWIRGVAKMGTMVAPGLLLASAGPLAVATGVGGMSAITTLLKKKSHYENEHRSYQRMQATNLTDYRNKRTNLANEVAGMKWYEGRFWGKKKRIRDQYNDYVLTTQDQLSQTNTLLANIKTYLKKGTVLTAIERDELGKLLADGLARLDYHKETGQNFLGSDDPTLAEKEYKKLQNAIIGGMLRLKITDIEELRTNMPYVTYYNTTKDTIEKGTDTGKEYNNQGYLKAKNRFNRRSRKKAGVGALRAGAISFGLSYLASSLASGTRSTTSTTETSTTMHHGQEGGEYNLGDWQEHLLVSGDVNPTMNSVINGSTSEITRATLYSSVDAASCSAAKGAAELAAANADLTTALSNPIVAGNPDLVSAINNYVADATSKIGGISGLSAGNHDLALARAIEAAKEGILEPIIASGNSSIVVNPTGLLWTDGGIQSSAGAVGQGFRNMGIMGLDYIQKGTETVIEHTTRAIPIPLPRGSNTFGAPKSDPK